MKIKSLITLDTFSESNSIDITALKINGGKGSVTSKKYCIIAFWSERN